MGQEKAIGNLREIPDELAQAVYDGFKALWPDKPPIGWTRTCRRCSQQFTYRPRLAQQGISYGYGRSYCDECLRKGKQC
jgi:hypothetical protein